MRKSHRGATPDKRAQGALESEILGVLWAEARPMSAGDVKAALDGDLAYNTVQTTLIRLLDKNLLERTKQGRAHLYSPTADEASTTAQRMAAYLAPGTDHTAVLAQFLSTLDPQDALVLRDLLRESDDVSAAASGSGPRRAADSDDVAGGS